MLPDRVSPTVAFLCQESALSNGATFEVGVGYVAQVRLCRAAEIDLGIEGHSPEDIQKEWGQIIDFSRPILPNSVAEQTASFERNLPTPMIIRPSELEKYNNQM